MQTQVKDKLAGYPSTEKFKVVDTIGVPHPYCIGSKHVAHASDHFFGMLGREAIIDAEKHGAVCDICRKIGRKDGLPILSYDEHKQALLIEVRDRRGLNEIPELREYLLSIKEQTERDGFEGWAFKQNIKEG